MSKLDEFEEDILSAYEKGELKSIFLSKLELEKFKGAATFSDLLAIELVQQPNIEQQR